MRRRNREGFTLIELLIAVAIIGILAAIGVANYLGALTRARQKRTMSDMRTIATAWEARAAESDSYVAAGFSYPASVMPFDDLRDSLEPGYIPKLPRMDAWGNPFEFAAEGKVLYAIRSPARDGIFEGTAYSADPTTSPDCDIVYANGSFVRFPASVQDK